MQRFGAPKGGHNGSRRRRPQAKPTESVHVGILATLKASNGLSTGGCSAPSGLLSYPPLTVILRFHLRLLTLTPLRGCGKNAVS